MKIWESIKTPSNARNLVVASLTFVIAVLCLTFPPRKKQKQKQRTVGRLASRAHRSYHLSYRGPYGATRNVIFDKQTLSIGIPKDLVLGPVYFPCT